MGREAIGMSKKKSASEGHQVIVPYCLLMAEEENSRKGKRRKFQGIGGFEAKESSRGSALGSHLGGFGLSSWVHRKEG